MNTYGMNNAIYFYSRIPTYANIIKYSKYVGKNVTKISPKPFVEIPGPKPIPFLGTLWMYWPLIGQFRWDLLHHAGMLKYRKWGSLVREPVAPGVTLLWVFNPDDIALVLKDAGSGFYPERRSHLALEKYRKDRPDVYNSGGLLPTNGAEWWRLRSEFQKGLSAPQSARQFLKSTDRVTQEFCNRVKYVGLSCQDFLSELARLNLELVCLMAFDARMNSFSEQELSPSSRSSRLIKAAEVTNSCILGTDQGFSLWKYIPTPKYIKLRRAQLYMESVAVDLVSQKMSYYTDISLSTESTTRSLLENYLFNSKLDLRDIIGMAADLLLAGIDTTSYTTGMLLYHLAKNPRVQNKLYEEAANILATKHSALKIDSFQKAKYTRAVLKESLRLNPISVGVGRILKKDVVLSGYHVPAGTVAVTQNQVACRLEKHFHKADEFVPERWLRSNQDSQENTEGEEKSDETLQNDFPAPHPFLSLPFGHGTRSCIARRVAEQNIQVLILRLIRNFEISWCGSKNLDIQTLLINKPDQPLKFTFRPRA